MGALAYALGIHTARCVWGKSEPGWVAFRGFLSMPQQSEDELMSTLEAWADWDPEAGQG